MKNIIKKCIFISLAFLLITSTVSANTLKKEEIKIAESILGEDGLHIVETIDRETITRAEMVDILMNFMSLPDRISEYKEKTFKDSDLFDVPFTDWNVESEKKQSVSWLCDIGIIRGDDFNIFRPDAPCTYAESITFIERATGYNMLAGDSTYNYNPTAIMKVAQQWFLFDEESSETEITSTNFYEDFLRILLRSLLIDRIEKNAYSVNEDYFTTTDCALNSFHHLYYKFGYAEKDESSIIIDGKAYNVGTLESSDFREGFVLCIYDINYNIVIYTPISREYNKFLETLTNANY